MIKNKFKRIVLDLGYVVRDGDEEMERHAMTSLYEDIMCLAKHDELYDAITVVDAPDAKEEDIPDFLLEVDDEDREAPIWPNPQKSLA
jgi:hypothetical protein